MATGIVYLVGAGPGDPGLLTLRAAELLERADVVVHDRLIHPDVLDIAAGAELVDVGKKRGDAGAGQDAINEQLVSFARAGKVVVRLKGGDPFVFGRGGEEAEHLAAAGVPFELVPGVTSAIAGPAAALIPLTHREHASWFAIATGHEDPSKESSSLDWDALARASSAVFLMATERLDRISSELMRAGRPGETPAALISWATWPDQRVVRSTLSRIAADSAGVEPPAVLVVGDVAAIGEKLEASAARPLAGKRVFVTRTREQAGKLSATLRRLGAVALEFPAIKIVPPESYSELDQALARPGDFTWVIFTSANAVEAVWNRLAVQGRDTRAFGSNRIAAVGPATAQALRARGIVADLVPSTYTSEALAAALGRPESTSRSAVLVPQPVGAPGDLTDALATAGWHGEVVAAYATEVDRLSADRGRAALEAGVDAILFTSGSTVRGFVDLWGRPPEGAVVCCIGPRTAQAAEGRGIRVDAVADEATVEALVTAFAVVVGA